MEKFKLEKDIHLFCVKADSFPAGIMEAHEKLTSLAEPLGKRHHFGVSYLYDNENLYLAAAEIDNTKETAPEGCTTYTLKKGYYISIYIKDFAKNISQIGEAFETLLSDPEIDEEGCCAEWYFPEGTDGTSAKDVRCMVRLAD